MPMTISGRVIEPGQPLFVIAELGLNHGGNPQRALQLVDGAAAAGASAVKVQSFRADRLVSPACVPPTHVGAESLLSFFRGFELDRHAHQLIAERTHRQGMAMIATPFDEEVIELLESVGCDAYKIASGDLTCPTLIERVVATGKPILLSTGMSDLDDIRYAIERARAAGGRQIALLHCVSAYPVPSGHENLKAITELSRVFGVPVGLSDHSTEPLSAPVAVALGASVYERHLALDGVPDQIELEVSSTVSELQVIIDGVERTRTVLGDGRKVCRDAEHENRTSSRRSLHAARDLHAGDLLDATAVVALRPAIGIDPRQLGDALGRRLSRDVTQGQPLHEADLVGYHVKGTLSEVA